MSERRLLDVASGLLARQRLTVNLGLVITQFNSIFPFWLASFASNCNPHSKSKFDPANLGIYCKFFSYRLNATTHFTVRHDVFSPGRHRSHQADL